MTNETQQRLSQEELDSIKEQILESIYADIGRSIVKKMLWISGAVVAALYLYLKGKGLT